MLSVIIPVLNNVRQFSALLEILVSYDNHQIEIIVIDGGSDDGTVDVIKQHSTSIGYWETGLDKGIADAFNRGIEKHRES